MSLQRCVSLSSFFMSQCACLVFLGSYTSLCCNFLSLSEPFVCAACLFVVTLCLFVVVYRLFLILLCLLQFSAAWKGSYSLDDFGDLNVDVCMKLFDSLCPEILDSIAPMTLMWVKPQTEPWLNESTHALRCACRQAERKWSLFNAISSHSSIYHSGSHYSPVTPQALCGH